MRHLLLDPTTSCNDCGCSPKKCQCHWGGRRPRHLLLVALALMLAGCESAVDEVADTPVGFCTGDLVPECPGAREWLDSVNAIKRDGGG